MIKKISAVIITALMCFSLVLFASADTDGYIFDPAQKLGVQDYYELNSYGEAIERQSGYAIIFCISDDLGGMTEYQYAEYIYGEFSDTENGLAFVHNITDEIYDIYINGDSKGVFTDEIIDEMAYQYNENSSWFGGIQSFYAVAETALDNAAYIPATEAGEAVDDAAEPVTEEFVKVERTLPLVVDNADIIPDDVEKKLLARCEELSEERETEVAIVTVTDLEGKDIDAFADDFYDYNGYGYGQNDDGVLVVYKPGAEGEREIWITTHGTAQYDLDDYTTGDIVSVMIGMLSVEDYEGAFNYYVDAAEEALKPGISFIYLFVFILVGAVIGLIITMSMASKNKSVVSQKNAKVYTRQGSMVVAGAADNFLYSKTSVREKPQNNSNNSSHTSSSGRTHGGSGAKF